MAAPDSAPNQPHIAVVTVSYGSEDVLPGFLDSITHATTSPVVVTIADNRPQPESTIEALANQYGARYLPMPRNVGYGAAMNVATAALPSEVNWVLISNPDAVLSPGSLDILVATAAEDESIAAVGPAVYNADGTLYPSARAVPSLRTGVGHAMFVNLWPSNPWSRQYRRDSATVPVRRDAGWLSGSCLLVKRSAFDQLGGFDPEFFMYFEDVDLGYRFGKSGFRNVYEPAAKVMHSGAHSTESDSAGMIAAHHRSARRFLAKKYSGALLWPVRASLTVGLMIRSALIERRARRQGDSTK